MGRVRYDALPSCFRHRLGTGCGKFPILLEVPLRLREEGCIRPDTRLVLNHFSHNCGDLHEELEAKAVKDGFEVAFDGMIVLL